MRKPVVLIVDDEEDILVLAENICSNMSCELHVASSGESAIVKMRSMKYVDIAISDLQMANMDGVTLLRHVRERHPKSIRILHSAYIEINEIAKLMEEGLICRALQKPISIERGRRYIATLIELSNNGYYEE